MRRGAPARSTLGVGLAAWSLFGALCAVSAYWAVRTHGHSPLKILAYELLVWGVWGVATPVVASLGRRFSLVPFQPRSAAFHAAAAIVFGLVHHVWWYALTVWLAPFDWMGAQDFSLLWKDVADHMFLEVLAYASILGVTYAVDYQREARARALRAAQLEASLSQAKLTALELQLQPHFLFNTLHAIGGLVRQKRETEAIEMIAGLSDLLRYSLDHAGKHLVTLEDELAIAGRYLAIQRLRFSDRLGVTIDADATARHSHVPALLLQPLVENAVRHGIERRGTPGTISVRARVADARLVVEVSNPGDEIRGEDGIGVTNTRERLAQLFGDQHSFELLCADGRVTARVTLPHEGQP